MIKSDTFFESGDLGNGLEVMYQNKGRKITTIYHPTAGNYQAIDFYLEETKQLLDDLQSVITLFETKDFKFQGFKSKNICIVDPNIPNIEITAYYNDNDTEEPLQVSIIVTLSEAVKIVEYLQKAISMN